jgi:hypothetical protein
MRSQLVRWPVAERGGTVRDSPGRVAELADAHGSGPCVLMDMGVQVPPRPLHRSRVQHPADGRIARTPPLTAGAFRMPVTTD